MKNISKSLGLEEINAASTGGRLVALNTMPWPRKEIMSFGKDEVVVSCGANQFADTQTLNNASPPAVTVKEVEQDVFVLENDHLRVQVEHGCICSLYDRLADRELIPKGSKANQLVIFEDMPLYWQAWDVEVYHLESRKELPARMTSIVLNAAHKVSVMTETKISEHSWAKTNISLSAALSDQPSYVEMQSEIEWRESMKFLKVEFPVDIRNSGASYETQFGLVRRPTHYNTR